VPAGAVLVHGLWHGTWAWQPVQERLTSAGVRTVAVELPLTSLDDDIAATRAALDEFGSPAVLVGHSYGGAVITGAGTHPLVTELVYLAAFQLAEGESVGRTLPDEAIPATRLGDALRFDGDLVGLDPELAVELMYHDVAPEAAAAAVARLRPVHRAVFSGVPNEIGWRSVASSYVVCDQDRTVHPDLERAMSARATRRVTWPCGHTPTLGRPDDVADLIVAATRR
jgi:pimeloyl-ACP methyl ester carboxylesterase